MTTDIKVTPWQLGQVRLEIQGSCFILTPADYNELRRQLFTVEKHTKNANFTYRSGEIHCGQCEHFGHLKAPGTEYLGCLNEKSDNFNYRKVHYNHCPDGKRKDDGDSTTVPADNGK